LAGCSFDDRRGSRPSTRLFPDSHPGVELSTLEHGFNDFHVIDGIGEWCRDGLIIQDREREAVSLNRVLVANFDLNFFNLVAALMP